METLTKEEVIAIINSVPLGYRTDEEHRAIERFADKLELAVLQAETGKVKISRD